MEHELKSAVVDAGCLLFFSEQQDLAAQQDVLDSLLYVQLAASKKHSKFVTFDKWNETWLAAASRFGWVLSANERISEPLPDGTVHTVWSLASDLAGRSVDAALMKYAESLGRKICLQVPEHEAVQLLTSETLSREAMHDGHPLTTVSLQIGFVCADRNMILTQIRLATCQSLTSGLLFDTLDPGLIKGNVTLTYYSMQLIEQVYATFRSAFDVALSGKRATLLKSLGELSHVRQG
ncbi:hypothetical protein G7013_12290 [Pseudomonas viridiflava]|uniref:hypothetical protein n=1 Tax=Pseudomonas viridiflava TaxID=33069 RepID=UPI0015E42AC4|nr:hypothetical protein [Pseudomonas viridiflava]MBA1230423.1 hypothetical protein [Pseudomonas viridiflava]